ncbi:MAG: glycosyltransferase family 9 protein [Cytophaga sp.]|nr:glycosyltransferase family 9 protein [Undibacterium sp.]
MLNTFSLKQLLMNRAIDGIRQPLSRPVSAVSIEDYIAEMGFKRLGWRTIRRNLLFKASGQHLYKVNEIKKNWTRGIWLYFGEGQIGDALMDLAPRSLLHERGICLDLLTAEHLSKVFQNDPWLNLVTSDVNQIKLENYDFAIVLNNKRRSLDIKRMHFKKMPWVSMLENFSGPNYHRSGFATQRFLDLLNINISEPDFNFHASQKLKNPEVSYLDEIFQKTLSSSIAICVGGVDPRRTYKSWDAVLKILIKNNEKLFILIGNNNGIDDAFHLTNTFFTTAQFINKVGETSIMQSHALLAGAKLVVTTDGGSMHLAATTTTPMVALFSSSIDPKCRLPLKNSMISISSSTLDVNDISPESVAHAVLSLRSCLSVKVDVNVSNDTPIQNPQPKP